MADGPLSYKTKHEAFVTGFRGSTVFEVILVCALCPASICLRHSLKKQQHIWLDFLLDYSVIVLSLLLSCTLLSSHILFTLITMAFIGSIIRRDVIEELLEVWLKNGTKGIIKVLTDLLRQSEIQLTHYVITEYRSLVLIGTSIAILAVDFEVFPRRFCKTETYGTGLMDIGVGAFMFVNGISSAEARGKFTAQSHSNMKYILKSIKYAIPLFALGLLRVLAVKSTDYHEHVSEYGVHWNFFITLAIVKVSSSLLFCIVPVRHSWILSIVVLCGYQYLLCRSNLQHFILHGPDGTNSRQGFLSANREGIFSSFGYLALYLASVYCGYVLALPGTRFPLSVKLLMFLLFDVILWMMLFIVAPDIIPVSRRLANFSYVIWLLALTILGLFSSFVSSTAYILFHKGATPQHNGLLGAVNKNGLLFFLLANVLTGLVNLSMDTVSASPVVGYLTLISYMFVLCLIAMCLYLYNIQLKFW